VRIDQLRLIAFGPFKDVVLDLSGGRQGFHLIYGPNEAGKSSALRALRHLLYGIPERSADDFVHPYARMRIGAALRSADGEVLEIVRRKGRSSTLRAANDADVLDEAVLQRFLRGVDADLFAVMFGLGYADLVRGGQDIIRGGGDVGRLVFSAGSGIANLREIQSRLQDSADQLFRPSGQKPRINEALARLKNHQKELRDAQLPGRQWIDHDTALRAALQRKQAVQAQLDQQSKDLSRLQRIRQALPLMAERKELTAELKKYAAAVLLPEGFPEERREWLTVQATAENRRSQARANIESHRRDIDGLALSPVILDNGELVETLHRELGSQGKAARDRVKLETLRSGRLAEAREILRNLRDDLTLEQAETLRIKQNDAANIRDLGARYERIATRIAEARQRLPELSGKMREVQAALDSLEAPPPVTDLRSALAEAEEYGPLEKQIRGEQVQLESLQTAAGLEKDRLGLAEKRLGGLEGLAVPATETIRTFEDRFDAADRRLADIDGERRSVGQALQDARRQIEIHRLEREVPTEDDLVAAREVRDRGWRLIAAVLGHEENAADAIEAYRTETPGSPTLAEAYERRLRQADTIADRLRREAERVADKARLLAEQAALTERMEQLEKERDIARGERDRALRQWTDLWQPLGIQPRSPREMGQWARDFRALAEKAADLRVRRAEADALQQVIDGRRAALDSCLAALAVPAPAGEESLAGLIRRAHAVVANQEELLRERQQLMREKIRLEAEIAAAGRRLESNEADLAEWQAQWETAVRPIGLGAGARPPEANTVMDELKSLFEKLKEAEVLKKRIEGIDRDADEFARTVADVVAVAAVDLADRPAEEAALELHQRLQRAREALARKDTLERQLELEHSRLAKAETDILQVETRLKGMCVEAGCERIDDLPEAERHSQRRRALESSLRSIDEQLRGLSGGAAVADFMAETATVDPDGIGGTIERLDDVVASLNAEKSELDQTIGSERTELGKMDGSSRAAELAEEIQATLGGLEYHVAQYARLKIAARVLSMAVERYRDKSQGPILKHGSALFNRITNGSFAGIRAEFDAGGSPVIVGVRPGGDIVAVDGMSDGTADQLYLALRVAGLETYLEANEPLPFVVDDILVMFDDRRATAALKVLAELSRKTQVIFFTHHRHLVELAEAGIDASVLVKNTLNL
jgi:uncharacterized protein YhaN